MNVNLRAPFLLTQALVPGMVEREFGRIINIGGTDAQDGWPRSIEAAVSKAGVLALTRGAASRVAGFGPESSDPDPSGQPWPSIFVTINATSPGSIAVGPRVDPPNPDWAQRYFARVPAGRRGHMEEFALTAVFLASPAAGYITGATIVVSGGMMV